MTGDAQIIIRTSGAAETVRALRRIGRKLWWLAWGQRHPCVWRFLRRLGIIYRRHA